MRLLMADMTVGMTVVTTIVLEGGRGGGRRWYVPIYIYAYIYLQQRVVFFADHHARLSLLIWLFLLANLTSGVVLPGFFFWYHRNVTIAAKSKSKPRGKVETALLSVLIGFTLPGILTFDPFSYGPEFQSYAIAGFVLFPVWIVGLQCVILPRFWRSGLVLIPAGKRRLSRKVQDRVVLIILGIGVAVVHFGTVWGVWLTGGGLEGLRGLVLRDVILRPEDEGGLYVRLLMFMQLDHLVTGVVMLVVAGEWVRNRMRTVGEGVGVVVGIALGGLVLGPGGVLAFAWAWRGRDEEEDEDKGRGEWKEK